MVYSVLIFSVILALVVAWDLALVLAFGLATDLVFFAVLTTFFSATTGRVTHVSLLHNVLNRPFFKLCLSMKAPQVWHFSVNGISHVIKSHIG